MKTIHQLLFLTLVIFSVFSCTETEPQVQDNEHQILSETLNLPQEPFDYTINLPAYLQEFFPETDLVKGIDPAVRDHQATLGRVLFYDTQLSLNNTVSCATCHDQKAGFGDNLRVSEGFNGEFGHRNSIALATTVGFANSYGGEEDFINGGSIVQFSWDDSVPNVQEQSALAITSEVEMGMDMDEVVGRLKQEKRYEILFKRAFGDLEINEERTLSALEVFINSIASTGTKFDQGAQNNHGDIFSPFTNYSPQENLGKELFNNNCTSCHSFNHALAFNPIANNGLDEVYEDQGKGGKTGNEWEMGMFKIPFLRNIAVTGPYMHDGRFATLEEVVDHYSEGIKMHPNLNHELIEWDGLGGEMPKRFNFSDEEKGALVAYLHTLTDESFMNEERFSDPFKR